MNATYSFNDVYPTIQGEGAMTGTPMVLLRTQGCDVGCPFCDTKETWVLSPRLLATIDAAQDRKTLWWKMTAEEISLYIYERWPHMEWILLTGGEPAEQNLRELVTALHLSGYKVAIETSGTAKGHMQVDLDWITVSPKWKMPGGLPVIPEVLATANEIKQVVTSIEDIDRLSNWCEHIPLRPDVVISLQPVSGQEVSTQLCMNTVLAKGTWRLSLQTHKFIGVR